MAKITVIDEQDNKQQIEIKDNLSLMELLRDAGYDSIEAICGGCCSCATCHVHIEDLAVHKLDVIEEDEELLVAEADGYDERRSRLSCQIELGEQHDGIVVGLVASDW